MDGDGAEPSRRTRRRCGWDDGEESGVPHGGTGPEQVPGISTALVPAATGDGAAGMPMKDTSMIKKLCKFWGWGSCQRAFDCPFAHGVGELNKDGLAQEFNLQILVEAEKDAASKGEPGKVLLNMLTLERTKLMAAQEQLALERQQREKLGGVVRESTNDFANRLMREELEKKIALMKAMKGAGKGCGGGDEPPLMLPPMLPVADVPGDAPDAGGCADAACGVPPPPMPVAAAKGSGGKWSHGAPGPKGAGGFEEPWDDSWSGPGQPWQKGGGGWAADEGPQKGDWVGPAPCKGGWVSPPPRKGDWVSPPPCKGEWGVPQALSWATPKCGGEVKGGKGTKGPFKGGGGVQW
uniref:C3H1-type domain-containing protein n=1 Tax=Alexandrium monilatum TaxID=311494 RepID=A0A7S4QD26_9DINO